MTNSTNYQITPKNTTRPEILLGWFTLPTERIKASRHITAIWPEYRVKSDLELSNYGYTHIGSVLKLRTGVLTLNDAVQMHACISYIIFQYLVHT